MSYPSCFVLFFFFNDTATTEIYTLSLQTLFRSPVRERHRRGLHQPGRYRSRDDGDRKSTRLNSSHDQNSYAVFCLKKKKQDEDKKTTEREKQYERQNRKEKIQQ